MGNAMVLFTRDDALWDGVEYVHVDGASDIVALAEVVIC